MEWMDPMNEVKSPKKPLIFYYCLVMIVLMLFNFLAMPYLSQWQVREVDYKTQTNIDRLVVELVKKQHEKARRLLMENREKLEELSKYLYEKETITGDEFMQILNQ